MDAAKKFARSGGLILGICNGFQILVESGLLPGALVRNRHLRFLCRQVHLRVENASTPFTCAARPAQVLQMPIAHGEGSYFCDSATLAELERNKQIIFRYVHSDGRDAAENDFDANPNGSLSAIAGVSNREGNVVGLMPHPERAVESVLGSADGRVILRSMVQYLSKSNSAGAVAAERVSA
jgi:phosphoribosylformylglycinamidine synthase